MFEIVWSGVVVVASRRFIRLGWFALECSSVLFALRWLLQLLPFHVDMTASSPVHSRHQSQTCGSMMQSCAFSSKLLSCGPVHITSLTQSATDLGSFGLALLSNASAALLRTRLIHLMAKVLSISFHDRLWWMGARKRPP